MEFSHKAIAGRFSFSKLFDALYSILCVSVDLILTFVYSLGMFIIWLVFAVSLWWYLLLLHPPKIFPNFYYSEFFHSYYSTSSPIFFPTHSIHQWPWIVPIRAFYFQNCLNLHCITWFVGLCPELMSHSQCMNSQRKKNDYIWFFFFCLDGIIEIPLV